MMKDISAKSKTIIKQINQDNLYKIIRVYEQDENQIIYSMTYDNKIHVSISAPSGPPHLKTAVDIFASLSSDNLMNYRITRTDRALYFLEKESGISS